MDGTCWKTGMWAGLLLAFLLCLPTKAQGEDDHFLGVQGGWHSVEVDYQSPVGIFADMGVPYLGWLVEPSAVPLHLRTGYGFVFDNGWQIRLGLRLDTVFALNGNLEFPFWEDRDGKTMAWLLLPEAEFRYDFDSGVCIGLVLPLGFVGGVVGDGDDETIIHWAGYTFIQAYLGYRWSL